MEGRFLISLEGLSFYSRIGMFDQERVVGNEFLVDAWFEVSADGFKMDRLDTTVSYADAYEIIREEMGKEWLLIESVAASIATRIKSELGKGEVGVSSVRVKIRKMAPPISGFKGTASVEYSL